jgi:hypothetical protein
MTIKCAHVFLLNKKRYPAFSIPQIQEYKNFYPRIDCGPFMANKDLLLPKPEKRAKAIFKDPHQKEP